ncbi:MAG: ATPase/topoisomerase-primase protein [Rhodospirillales bacterium]|nr:ATPase/topoisomerase-primase protein [Rhodospirillales bacterium]
MDSTAIFDVVRSVTGAWARQRKAEEREASRVSRRRDALVRSRRMTIREAAWSVMPRAYLKASSGGTLPAHARQIMYAARGEIQRLTGRTLDDQYFTQQLLPDFMNEHPSATAEWDVVFDARGHFHEPHTGRTVALGTIEVRRYLRDVAEHTLPELQVGLPEPAIFPTCGPDHRYGAILFVEKEGFLPLFRAVHLAERYDLAIMSTKGLSVTASRLLVDRLCAAHQVPLLVLHDFDKSGFSILGTLRRDTRRYAFRNRIEVVDLGLRLEDVEDSELEAEDVVHRSDPAPNLRENGATAEEIAFMRTRRVELNAFASADFVAWIERKLGQHGITKVLPDNDSLTLAYRRGIASDYIAFRLRGAIEEARQHAADAPAPDDLASRVADGMRADPARSWDELVWQLVLEHSSGRRSGRLDSDAEA